jgi:RNA polymerase sigma-70 factor (ECF subfamily)
MTNDERLTRPWRDDRAYLLAIASRILADPVEAEDVVQDAFARLAVQRLDKIADTRAWLVVVVRRIALDRLGSAHRRLSTPSDSIPAAAHETVAADPAEQITLDDEVRRALGVILDRLRPAERTAFVLHDVFGVPFEQVAEIVGRSPAACRQNASRARRAIREQDTIDEGRTIDPELLRVADRFVAACAGGNMHDLVRLLDPDISGWATLDGGEVGATRGAVRVARTVLTHLGSDKSLMTVPLEDQVGVLVTRRAVPYAIIRLQIEGQQIAGLRTILLPA